MQPSAEQQHQAQSAAPAAARAAAARLPRQKCEFWVARKNRCCRFEAIPGHKFCGNHFAAAEQEGGGPRRVVCPYDPRGAHTVLETELEKHRDRCPALKLERELKSQPCYREDVNAGSGPEAALPLAGPEFADRKGRADSAAARRAAYAAALGPERFQQLLSRIEAAFQQLCARHEPVSVLRPAEAEPYLREGTGADTRAFSLKHATQQASIVGNMQQAGLLAGAEGATYVEFGAGKGYLTCMLADCCPSVQRVVVMDVRGFQLKADRAMRHLQTTRLRLDIKDFDPAGLPDLAGGAAPWVGLGKHLCGAATDFTLRCCGRLAAASAAAGERQGPAGDSAGPPDAAREPNNSSAAGPGTAAAAAQPGSRLRGLAVATCCHHRCSWRHYVGQRAFLQAGFSPEEFEVISWMTGWALCGHEAPAGFGVGKAEGEGEEGGSGMEEGGSAATTAAAEGGEEPPGPAAGPAAEVGPQGGPSPPAKRQHLEGGGACTAAAAAAEPVGGRHASGSAAGGGGGEGDVAQQLGAQLWGSWRPHHSLPRAERIAVGQKCKRLIDAGRLAWLREQGFQAQSVCYVPPEVSGENRLLLATLGHTC